MLSSSSPPSASRTAALFHPLTPRSPSPPPRARHCLHCSACLPSRCWCRRPRKAKEASSGQHLTEPGDVPILLLHFTPPNLPLPSRLAVSCIYGMAEVSMQVASVSGDPIAKLTDDILADIISRVPYKSTCCCKCVSTRWRDLISHPYHDKKMPQSVIGFFYESYGSFKLNSSFTNISGKFDPLVDPSLSFLPRFDTLTIKDCCNGLLLCSFYRQNAPEKKDYVVCNPATEKWVVVPGTDWSSEADVRLAFDPAVSSHFHVCEFVEGQFWFNKDYIDSNYCIAAVVIYSSKTGVWSHKDNAWNGYDIETPPMSKSVLFRGVLYLCAFDHKLVALDVEENNWKVILVKIGP